MARTRPTRPAPITVAGENRSGGASGKRILDPHRRGYVVYLANWGHKGTSFPDQMEAVGAGPVGLAPGHAAFQVGQGRDLGDGPDPVLVELAQRVGEVAAACGPQGEPVAVEEREREHAARL